MGNSGLLGSVLPDRDAYRALARALLPERLLALVIEAAQAKTPLRLVIVPDEALFGLPFAALVLDEDHLLVHGAVSSVCPTLSLYASAVGQDPPSASGGVSHLDSGLVTDAERKALDSLGSPYGPVSRAITRGDVTTSLAGPLRFMALGVHCDDEPGLRQSLLLADGTGLSAGALLGRPLPYEASLGACYVARLPLGLATVFLTQGTSCLLAPLGAANDVTTDAVLAACYARLGEDTDLTAALRLAQLHYLEAHPGARPRHWASIVAMGA